MRKLLWLLIFGVVIWSGWWVIASVGMQRGVSAWFLARKAEGWQAELTDIERAGYPTHIQTHLVGLQVADPETGVAVELDEVSLSAPAYWPGYLTINLPEEPILLASPYGRSFLGMAGSIAELRVRPGTQLEFQSMLMGAQAWAWFNDSQTLLNGDAMRLQMVQSEAEREVYKVDFDALNLTPGPEWRETVALPSDWPQAFESVVADMTVIFDRPWTREALDSRRPQPVVVTLHGIKAIWGDLSFRALGDINVDPFGVPEGRITVKIENWQQMLALAETSGIVSGAFRFQAEAVLGALAQMTGSTKGLDVDIVFADGKMTVGPVSLGKAPSFRIR